MSEISRNKSDNVAAVLKVFSVLETLAEEGRSTLSDISQRAMTSKATTHRLLQTMVDLGYAEQEDETEKYRLTLKLFGLGARTLRGQSQLLQIADSAMGVLSRETGESVNLGVMDDREQRVAYIHKYDSIYSLSMNSPLGKRNPLHSTSLGKALLAFRDETEIDERLSKMTFEKLAPKTITDEATLRKQLSRIRQDGYSEEVEESEVGVRCIAVPIRDHLGKSIAAISVSFPLFRYDPAREPTYIRMLLEAGLKSSRTLGFNG